METTQIAPEIRDEVEPEQNVSSPSRRKFIGTIGGAAAAAATVGAIGLSPAIDSSATTADAARAPAGATDPRVVTSFILRAGDATVDALVPVPPHTTNGDESRYADHSASYSKGLLQDAIGVVNPAAWASFKKALLSGKMSDYEAIIIGGTRTQNGPQGAYTFDLEGLDSVQYGNTPSLSDPTGFPIVPPFDQITSPEYGAQLAELYWSSLLYDVAFTDYAGNATAVQAAAELNTMPGYRGPRDGTGTVTPDLLFRGNFPGETIGPYMSQFMITPTSFGSQPLDQQFQHFLPGIDYMTDTTTFQEVQNGISTGLSLSFDQLRRYLHNGRGLAAYTHVDVLFQAYFTAFLVMAGLKFPVNPGNPYVTSRTQNGFCSFGGPDFAASLGEVAARALQKVWYQKWIIHLTHRPESGGGVLHQIKTNAPSKPLATLNSNILNSQAPQQVFTKYGTYLLPQPFPEGSPTHPSYPTGHGTVGGACITMLKFFFDENYVIPNPMMPTDDGLGLVPYTGPALTVGGELNKLARNVTFGHGVLAGIHWRADSDWSMTLGEAMAIAILQDKAKTYNEKFTVSFTKLDGHKVTITNQ
jgi:hypothetical protein